MKILLTLFISITTLICSLAQDTMYVSHNGNIIKYPTNEIDSVFFEMPETPAIQIGDYRDGGVVFWIDPTDNTHGLVCAIENLGPIQWYKSQGPEDNISIITKAEIGTGSANTDSIIATQTWANETEIAAGIAKSYEGGGYTDWYLPSKDELLEMWLYIYPLSEASSANGGVWFEASGYWSSTNDGFDQAWYTSIDGDEENYSRGTSLMQLWVALYIRPVRSF